MAEKTSAEVVIGGKVYTLSGYESEEYLQKVAVYINGKLNEFDSIEGYQRFPADMKATLLQLNIADDYFKAKAQAEKLEREIEAKEKEIYNLKHDLIAEQIQHKYKYAKRLHWRQGILGAEIIILFIVGFIPQRGNMIATVLVSFACAMQVQSFRKVNGFSYASTMCIGNLRSGTAALSFYLRERRPE